MTIDFACMADEGYLRWTELCVRAIEQRQPGSRIHLYDLSERSGSALASAFARHPSVAYIHHPPAAWRWPRWVDEADFDFIWPNFDLRETVKYWSRKVRRALGARNETWMTDKAAHVRRVRHFLRLVAQKPSLIARTLDATPRDFVFIDVDAIVLRPLDEVFERDFDFAVTSEAPADVVIGPEPPACTDRPHYPYKAINVGVMFARNNAATRALVPPWIEAMETVRHLSIEQTALAELLYRRAPGFLESHYRTHAVDLPGGRVKVMAVPMALYNFTGIRPSHTALAPDKFVAHFAGGKKQERHWDWVRRLIFQELA